MSATGRGSQYVAGGVYYTDPKTAAVIVADLVPLRSAHRVIDPHAGGGSFIGGTLATGHNPALVYAMDIDPNAPALVTPQAAYHRHCASFLSEPVRHEDQIVQAAGAWPAWWPRPDIVLMNPPYGEVVPGRKAAYPVAEYHLRRGLELATVGMGALLRLSVTGSEWFTKLPPPRQITVLRPRPSFTGGPTDAASYCWVWWRRWPAWRGPTRERGGSRRRCRSSSGRSR